jgi:hypothetical protein
VEVLDCCLTYGRPAVPVGRPYLSSEEVISEMDRLGIAECWCTGWRALENSAVLGNRMLGDELAGSGRLHPVWVVLPPGTDETPAPRDLLAEMRDAGVGLVRAEPGRHGYSLEEWCCGQLWAALEDGRVPVLLSSDRWGQIDAMLSAHPGLPVILTGTGYRANRVLYPLLDGHANLRLEISTYLTNEGLRDVAARFGAERLIYGSGSPTVCPEEALGTLNYSGLSDAEKSAVAGGNLRALLAEARS